MSNRLRVVRRFLLMVSATFACAIGGCVNQSNNGDSTVITFAWWVPVSLLLGGVAAGGLGWLLKRKIARLGWGLLIGGPIVAIIVAPGMFFDRVTVDDKHFTLNTGMWFSPTFHDVRFGDLREIELISEESRGRRGRKRTSYYLLCLSKSGGDQKIPVGTLMEEGGAEEILRMAQQQGIPVTDRTHQP